MVVLGSEVLALLQHTLCLIGNASELISQTRWSKVLEAVDLSWSKFGSDDSPSAQDTLFGEEFQSSLTNKVEKDTALSKAVTITKRSKWGKHPPFLAGRAKKCPFFEGALLPSTEAGRARASFCTIHNLIRTEKDILVKEDSSPTPTGKVRSLFTMSQGYHRTQIRKTPLRKFWDFSFPYHKAAWKARHKNGFRHCKKRVSCSGQLAAA